jgi:hypothetical protein
MTRRTLTLGISWLGLVCFVSTARGGGSVTPTQTQSTSPAGVLVDTNWTAGTAGINNPLVFNQFNPSLGTLTSINITMTSTIRNDYELVFTQTPTPTTLYVATSATSDPSVLANPALRAQLTDGPNVTLYGPNGTTQLFGAPGTSQPVDFVTLTEPKGTYSSLLPVTNPNYIPPTVTEQSFQRMLTAADSASLFNEFIGTGTVDLPVIATAFSSFYSNTGNGGGGVITTAGASVSIQYGFEQGQQIVPEPSGVFLLGLGAGLVILASRRDRRAESLS